MTKSEVDAAYQRSCYDRSQVALALSDLPALDQKLDLIMNLQLNAFQQGALFIQNDIKNILGIPPS